MTILFTWFRNIQKLQVYVIALSLLMLSSCKKFLAIDPPTSSLENKEVFKQESTATASILNIYAGISQSLAYDLSAYPGLYADELIDFSNNPDNASFETNSLQATNFNIKSIWSISYNLIYAANSAIEGLSVSKFLHDTLKTKLISEVKVARAYLYFNLVNLYGPVPLITSTEVAVNKRAPRSEIADVYTLIVNDLEEAQTVLNDQYLDADNHPGFERVRPNNIVATALLARIYLYVNEWEKSADQATSIISNSNYALQENLSEVFLKNNTEAIWQVMPVQNVFNTVEGSKFIPTTAVQYVSLSTHLLNAFENNDLRKLNWTGSALIGSNTIYYPYKYKSQSKNTGDPYTEYSTIIRLAEMYLIRAEARANLGLLDNALSDLNTIRQRAGLSSLSLSTKEEILKAVMKERQVELFTEYGQRWFDLKRTGTANTILAPIKGTNWQTNDLLFPIPQSEILNNPVLTQNPGF
jgi:starch-binding outer membrane protein, SusD/RagB family